MITLEAICILFILLFTYAAVSKVITYDAFVVQIGKSPLLTDFAGLLAWLVPGVELAITGLLAVPRWRKVGLYGAFSLMVMFTAYITAILQFSEHIPCSCGGVLAALGWTEHLVFNIGFVILGIAGIFLNGPKEGYPGQEKTKSVMA